MPVWFWYAVGAAAHQMFTKLAAEQISDGQAYRIMHGLSGRADETATASFVWRWKGFLR